VYNKHLLAGSAVFKGGQFLGEGGRRLRGGQRRESRRAAAKAAERMSSAT
jgi:hypothetical protein